MITTAVRLRVLVGTGETHHYVLTPDRGDWSWSDDGRRLVIRPQGSRATRIEYPVSSVVKVDVVILTKAASALPDRSGTEDAASGQSPSSLHPQ